MRNSKRSRILHVFGSLQRGGAEMRTLEVLRLLDRDRFDFAMVALSGQRGELAPVAEAELRSGLMASAGSLMPLIERPVACAMLILSAALFVWPFIRSWRKELLNDPENGRSKW